MNYMTYKGVVITIVIYDIIKQIITYIVKEILWSNGNQDKHTKR